VPLERRPKLSHESDGVVRKRKSFDSKGYAYTEKGTEGGPRARSEDADGVAEPCEGEDCDGGHAEEEE
jgi:hypothetical protein